MTTVKITGECYTVATDVGSGAYLRNETREGHYQQISDAVRYAMNATLNRGVGCKVLRVTMHEPFTDNSDWPVRVVTETVTGEIDIPGPRSYAYHPELSRYHPVNGWAVPETLEIT